MRACECACGLELSFASDLAGTGHGVGSFLNVHEGPIGISYRPRSGAVALQAGMIVTDGVTASNVDCVCVCVCDEEWTEENTKDGARKRGTNVCRQVCVVYVSSMHCSGLL